MNGTNTIMRRLAHANIAANVGAGMLGIAVGLLFHNTLMRYFPGLLLLGLALHGLGMFDRYQIEKRIAAKSSWWMRGFYAACWIALAAIVGHVLIVALRR